MDSGLFRTIESVSAGTYREKGSKFLAFAYPVQQEGEAKQHVAALKKQYHDARHHCFAWVLGPAGDHSRAYDDGEPGHSAGDPILGQIRSRSLTNILIVVVRYFGGVKLGVGGLINAYRTAAEEALNNAVIVTCEVRNSIKITYPYTSTAEVMRLVKEQDIYIRSQDFAEECVLHGEVRPADQPVLNEKIRVLQAMGHAILIE